MTFIFTTFNLFLYVINRSTTRYRISHVFYQNDAILDLLNLKAFTDNKLKVTLKQKFLRVRVKTLWKKDKMLVISIFSFHNVFKRLHSYDRQNSGDCEQGTSAKVFFFFRKDIP